MSAASTVTLVRPMAEADIPQVVTITAEAFGRDIPSAVHRRTWEFRLRSSLVSDPAGSFVSERAGRVTGAAQALIREGLWILSLMAVSPALGTGGEGRALMDAALGYDTDTRGGLIITSDDPRALRLYASSGFSLEAAFRAAGVIDPALIPKLDPDITPVDPQQLGTLAPISRAARGGAHTPDLEVARVGGASFFQLGERGFVVTYPGRGIWMLAARDEQAASALLWYGLKQVEGEPNVEIGWITGRQQWALDICLAARLSFTTYGSIGTRGSVGPLQPYIPSPPFA